MISIKTKFELSDSNSMFFILYQVSHGLILRSKMTHENPPRFLLFSVDRYVGFRGHYISMQNYRLSQSWRLYQVSKKLNNTQTKSNRTNNNNGKIETNKQILNCWIFYQIRYLFIEFVLNNKVISVFVTNEYLSIPFEKCMPFQVSV